MKKKLKIIEYFLLIMIAVLSFEIINRAIKNQQSKKELESVLEEFEDNLADVPDNDEFGEEVDETSTSKLDDPTNLNPTNIKIGGKTVVGKIRISSVGLALPILSETDGEAMYITCVQFAGEVNKPGNLVLAGHRTKDGFMFFGKISNAKIGSTLQITGTDGNVVTYTVTKNYVVDETDTSILKQNTDGKRMVTLFTCIKDQPTKRSVVVAVEK